MMGPVYKVVRRSYHQASSSFDISNNVLEFQDQTVFAGTQSLNDLFDALLSSNGEGGIRKPLIVTDEGIAKLGLLDTILDLMRNKYSLEPAIFDKCVSNPGVDDIVGIAQAYINNSCNLCIGVGGGGPLDAAKGGMALVAQQLVDPGFQMETHAGTFVSNKCRTGFATYVENTKGFSESVPLICAIPTTSGTGSDGGKSAVICDSDGMKVVFGHPSLMPKYAALSPELTQNMPANLTAATGIDALFHSLEAYLVPTDIMVTRDGMTLKEIEYCDSFALKGIQLVCENLLTAVSTGTDLSARLNMQVAALYGAKAFRKGDLGGVHASAHALGALFHLHHGACIARMAVPVLEYSETMQDYPQEARERSSELVSIFKGAGVDAQNNDRLSAYVLEAR